MAIKFIGDTSPQTALGWEDKGKEEVERNCTVKNQSMF